MIFVIFVAKYFSMQQSPDQINVKWELAFGKHFPDVFKLLSDLIQQRLL
jgi:hypothetical protein